MTVSRTIAYAVHAVLHLARAAPGVPIPSSQLAREGKMPERFLLQILRTLVTQGLLNSARGVDGGYYLSRSPDKITLLEVIETFENPLEWTLPEMPGMVPALRSRVVQAFVRVGRTTRGEFQKITFADLLA